MPTPPPGRELLASKRVVVTAAAGTGIGSAVAERCLLEGAQVLISDIHERRLGETADRLTEATGVRPHTVICNVTVEDDVQALVVAAVLMVQTMVMVLVAVVLEDWFTMIHSLL